MANAKHTSTERLFAAVRDAQAPSLRLEDAGERARAKARLLQAIDEVDRAERPVALPQTSGGRRGWTFGLGTLAAAACAFAVMFAWPGEQQLEYAVDGTEYTTDAMIVADDAPRLLAFSDSTSIELAPHGRMQMSGLRDNGATVMLAEGQVELAVHHEHDTSWQVHAGPWTVHVTGTQFVVEWEPSTEYFRVAVSEGSVRVEGPEGELAKLRAGESIVRERGKARIEPETLQIADARRPGGQDKPEPEPDAIERPSELELEPEPMTAEETSKLATSDARHPKPKRNAPTWLDHFDDSDYEQAWDTLAALPGGIHGQGKQASASTLLDLADVARFTKHRDDAAKLLEHLRDRHPGSSEAAQAAFTLGRLTASSGSQSKAAAYFELYLAERPAGSHAADALGRLMDCYDALGDDAKARARAQKYLAGHPHGPHADKARSILGQ